jgi:hypothetical protein
MAVRQCVLFCRLFCVNQHHAHDDASHPLMHQEPGKGAGPRNRVIDHMPEGAQYDPDYQKFQRELEDTQQGQGFLFGRGAFDRQDIMYLKELKEEVGN